MSSINIIWYILFQQLFGFITPDNDHVFSISGLEKYHGEFLGGGPVSGDQFPSTALLSQCSVKCLLDSSCSSYTYDWLERSCDLDADTDTSGNRSVVHLMRNDITIDEVSFRYNLEKLGSALYLQK